MSGDLEDVVAFVPRRTCAADGRAPVEGVTAAVLSGTSGVGVRERADVT